MWLHLGKQKEPITQSIRNRRERGSRFKMMFYVIGSEDQSRVLLHTAPANRTKGVVEQFGTSGVPIPRRMNRLIMSQYGRTFLFSCYVAAYRCAIIIRIMSYDVKLAKPLTVFGTTENENQRLQKKFSYLLGHFQRNINGQKKFCPTWAESSELTSRQLVGNIKLTSNQVGRKSKIQLLPNLDRSQKSLRRNLQRSGISNFDTGCVEVRFAKSKALTFCS